MTLTLNGCSYTPTTIGNHDFIKLDVADYCTIDPIPTNRDSERRVPKMRKTFDDAYYSNQTSTLTEVAIAIVAEDFQDPDTGTTYSKGDWYIVDGNTRKHYWIMYPERAKEISAITAKIHYLRSMEDVRYAYYPYNNAKSTEKASEILTGLARRYNWAPRQHIFTTGAYKTALDWAAYTPGEDKPDVFKAFNICFEALKIVDSIPQNGNHTLTSPAMKSLKSQAIVAACLLALRFNPNNLKLHDLIYRLATIEMPELQKAAGIGELDPVQIIASEYSGHSINRTNDPMNTMPWLGGLARSTKFESQAVQMDFLMYWITKYIESPKATWNFNKGVKPTLWEGFWIEYFPEEVVE
ncbi:MAG: hypothetical protein ACO295_08575 [Sediminibacterium sp.]